MGISAIKHPKLEELSNLSFELLQRRDAQVDDVLGLTRSLVNGKNSSFMVSNDSRSKIIIPAATGPRSNEIITSCWIPLQKDSITDKILSTEDEFLISQIENPKDDSRHRYRHVLSSNYGNSVVHTTNSRFTKKDGPLIYLVAYSLSNLARNMIEGKNHQQISLAKGQLSLQGMIFDSLNGFSDDNPYKILVQNILSAEQKGDYKSIEDALSTLREKIAGNKLGKSGLERAVLKIGETLVNNVEGEKTYKYDSASYEEIRHSLDSLAKQVGASFISEGIDYVDVNRLVPGQDGLDHYEQICKLFPTAESLRVHNTKNKNLVVLQTPETYGVVMDGNHTVKRAKELGLNCLYAKVLLYSNDSIAEPYKGAGNRTIGISSLWLDRFQ